MFKALEQIERETDFGFNEWPLGYGDFKRICRKYNIHVLEKPLLSELKGILVWYNDHPYVCINSRLQERERTFVAYCELGHFFMHDKTNHFFTKMRDKWQLGEMEYESHVFSYLCIIPTPDLIEVFTRRRSSGKPMDFRYLSELSELYHTTFPITDSRLRIFYDYIFMRPDILSRSAWPV